MKKVIVGMSGGVDSSTAAILLQKEGYEVIGITLKTMPNFDDLMAKSVCKQLGIEHHTINIEKEFKSTIIDSFIEYYKKGLTPNPCVLCNKEIKMKYLYEAMKEYKADYIATGHYARIENNKLTKSKDLNKDQTYFLSEVPIEILEKTLFPLEGITKEETRKIAEENGLINAHKKDSYDVCFITEKFKEFIKENIGNHEGNIINIETNKVIGKHNGLNYYTIGQRRGLNIGGNQDRLFVVGKDINKNILYVQEGNSNKYLESNSCIVENFNKLVEENITECTAKFRYRANEANVTIEYLDNNKILVKYDNEKSVTKGQICTLYSNNVCIGGGEITEIRKDNEKLWYQ